MSIGFHFMQSAGFKSSKQGQLGRISFRRVSNVKVDRSLAIAEDKFENCRSLYFESYEPSGHHSSPLGMYSNIEPVNGSPHRVAAPRNRFRVILRRAQIIGVTNSTLLDPDYEFELVLCSKKCCPQPIAFADHLTQRW